MSIQIDGHTRLFGVIGNPIAHTMSPVIHNTLAEQLGHNLVYVALPVKDDLEGAVRGARAFGFGGMNVTVPYKSEVIGCLKEIDGFAEKIGAVNTLVPIEGGFKGYNTDMPGLYRAMESDGVKVSGEQVIILGAGGAGRSVAMLALEKGAEHVYLLNRTAQKAALIAAEINALAGRAFVTPMELGEYPKLRGRKYLCVQATSVGLYPNVDQAVITDTDFYEMVHTGYDVIYNPYETRFMQMVKAHGGKAYNGLKMLLYQGIIAYELWNDIVVPKDKADLVLRRLREALGI